MSDAYKKSHFKKIFLAGVLFALSSCANPFDLKAIQKEIAKMNPFTGRVTVAVVSGAQKTVTTGAGYKVESSVGVLTTQPTVATPGNYRVTSSLNVDQ